MSFFLKEVFHNKFDCDCMKRTFLFTSKVACFRMARANHGLLSCHILESSSGRVMNRETRSQTLVKDDAKVEQSERSFPKLVYFIAHVPIGFVRGQGLTSE